MNIENWLIGIDAVLDPGVLIFIVLGCLVGIVVGALPGISATVGVAVLLPFTFSLDPLPGMMLLLGIYGGAVYAGSIPAILIRSPGTPASAATVEDGNAMAKQGRAAEALSISVVASSLGGLAGVVALGLFAPLLAGIALAFGPAEYFLLAVLALTVVASVSENRLVKGLISGVLGVGLALIGLDTIQAYPRLSFDDPNLAAGIGFIPVLIGLFAVSEAFVQFERSRGRTLGQAAVQKFRPTLSWLRGITPPILLSSPIGFIIGIIPGTGGDISAFVAYNEAKRAARDKRRFGKGEPRGIAAAETAKNAGTAGALVPMLTLGIPGDVTTAVLIGAITVHGLRPGPELFTGSPELVYGIFVGFLLTYLVMLVIGLLGTGLWSRLITGIPTRYLWPTVLVLSMIGAFAVRSNPFDVLVMVVFGVIGYLMTKFGFPLAPMVIGLIVGPIAESGYRRTMIIHDGGFGWLLEPIPLVLSALIVLSVGFAVRRAVRSPSGTEAEGDGHEPPAQEETRTVDGLQDTEGTGHEPGSGRDPA
ncbi:tripartite tricarboxylate transporter permease [Nocardiopsis sp. HNM0947]|uniref:Tripartite tricarboxylate transporter permease n=1 Tax=Nocardiopsis coralli TaxID=2772213 RepID=A0ABR9P2X0_9ACTN|nr:tripartite tricarboxylate transporter permease [Nocardiopsis coralli]MBE2998192.1 tripartite tricarboxylate transporter permease [Nocardiopsis coralli]